MSTLPLLRFFNRLADNPIVIKELRGKMRSRRAFADLTIYLTLVSTVIVIVYLLFQEQANNGQMDPAFRQNVGKTIFGVVIVLELLMIGFIGPALTTGAITGERERQTYDLLRTTLISPRMLVLGKLVSACAYLLLLVFAATPIEALAFLLGGVGLEEICVSTLILLVNIVFFCALGLLCSSFARRTLTSTITSYSIILLSLLATGLILYICVWILQTLPSSSPEYVALNIFSLYFCSINSLLTSLGSESFLTSSHVLFYGPTPFNYPNGQSIFVFSPWVVHVPLVAILSTIMILSSILFVNRAER